MATTIEGIPIICSNSELFYSFFLHTFLFCKSPNYFKWISPNWWQLKGSPQYLAPLVKHIQSWDFALKNLSVLLKIDKRSFWIPLQLLLYASLSRETYAHPFLSEFFWVYVQRELSQNWHLLKIFEWASSKNQVWVF